MSFHFVDAKLGPWVTMGVAVTAFFSADEIVALLLQHVSRSVFV